MNKYYNVLSFVMIFVVVSIGEGQLVENFYSSSCPNVEGIVRQAVATKISQQQFPSAIPATIRLLFHDCFVEGCDASVLIFSPNNDAEKDAPDNLSLAGDGFDTVIRAKEAVEAQCPGVVSCADILAIAARDVVVMAGGPAYNVELGRLDGLVSIKSRVAVNLPDPSFSLIQLTNMFAQHNLSLTDMIALSGCHTIGSSHCSRFANRIQSNTVDPTLDPTYAMQLRQSCPPNVDLSIVVPMDPVTSQTFDNVYYQNLIGGKGLFTSDQVLFTDPSSQPTVMDFANNPGDFSAAFVEAVTKLGRVGVKTGNEGEIRRDCTRFNS